jgi:hypothetical protein
MSLKKFVREAEKTRNLELRSKNAEKELIEMKKVGKFGGWVRKKDWLETKTAAGWKTTYNNKENLCLSVFLNDDIGADSNVYLDNCRNFPFRHSYLKESFEGNQKALAFTKRILKNREDAVKIAKLKEKVI